MIGRAASAFVIAWALACPSPAFAESLGHPISIDSGPLTQGLKSLQRQTGIELLFDSAVVSDLESPAVEGTLTNETALQQLLSKTELTLRKATSGAWIIERSATEPLAQQDVPVAEILVVGRRTQNADIRRFENDVQPYTVVTQSELARSHRDTIDQYFASRVTANTIAVPSSLQQDGSTLSEIDLRGLGSTNTLVLVDGRRMPSVPASAFEFLQSDINAIPLHAIERVEILTGTAGGIYGFGALGGVVNVVLDRSTSGVDLHFTGGISSRSDSSRQSVEAKLGHTFGDGATDLVLFAAHSQAETVLAGQRNFSDRDRRRTFELAPGFYEVHFRNANSVNVASIAPLDPVTGTYDARPDLVLKPEFGGATLSSDHTFLPVGFSGDAGALAAGLSQHAGQDDFALTESEAQADLGSNPETDALFANIRHRFGERLEVFADAILLRGRGESAGDRRPHGTHSGYAFITSESPVNPFTNDISVSFPIQDLEESTSTRVESTRYGAGLLAELPGDWRGSAEMSWGGFHHEIDSSGEVPGNPTLVLTGDPSDLETNPFGDWNAFQRAIGEGSSPVTFFYRLRTQFRDKSLRLAGPVFSNDAGPSTLTLLAEHRKEEMPTHFEGMISELDGKTTVTEDSLASRSIDTTSLYAELRARLFGEIAPVPFVRGLELQLAVRRDEEKHHFARDPGAENPEYHRAEFAGTTYTAGAKVMPTSWLLLRGSYATGEQPPPLYTLNETDPITWDQPMTTDPQRGGTYLGADGPYTMKSGGDASLKTARATTMSVGAVLMPFGSDGARLAVDYSHIRRTRDVFQPDFTQILLHEDFWPERVERAPLTDADRANGYTAGRVTMFDMRIANGSTVEVKALDIHADWPVTLFGGRLNLYADATRDFRNVTRAPFVADVNRVGYREGPLKWKANGGFDWSKGSLTLGANAQYYDSSLVFQHGLGDRFSPEIMIGFQGSPDISSQWYLDLHGRWQVPLQGSSPLENLSVELGIVNVLDKEPPRESFLLDVGPGYSRLGDPRMRRFDLVLSFRF